MKIFKKLNAGVLTILPITLLVISCSGDNESDKYEWVVDGKAFDTKEKATTYLNENTEKSIDETKISDYLKPVTKFTGYDSNGVNKTFDTKEEAENYTPGDHSGKTYTEDEIKSKNYDSQRLWVFKLKSQADFNLGFTNNSNPLNPSNTPFQQGYVIPSGSSSGVPHFIVSSGIHKGPNGTSAEMMTPIYFDLDDEVAYVDAANLTIYMIPKNKNNGWTHYVKRDPANNTISETPINSYDVTPAPADAILGLNKNVEETQVQKYVYKNLELDKEEMVMKYLEDYPEYTIYNFKGKDKVFNTKEAFENEYLVKRTIDQT
ncbi:MAG: hypothetical protein HRT99_01715 [Mycoplasmatales bacterium]|nr:hypothetical protein [Mycoplasmatales bacterium]